MLVKAGSAVDAFIDQLVPLLEKGDIIIDGGNSEYTDSIVSQHVPIQHCDMSMSLLFLVAPLQSSGWQRDPVCGQWS